MNSTLLLSVHQQQHPIVRLHRGSWARAQPRDEPRRWALLHMPRPRLHHELRSHVRPTCNTVHEQHVDAHSAHMRPSFPPVCRGSRNFSSCSADDFEKMILSTGGTCLLNVPRPDEAYSAPYCGNRLVDVGEECDCGSEKVRAFIHVVFYCNSCSSRDALKTGGSIPLSHCELLLFG